VRSGLDLDAVVVGAGPNGLAAAIELARAGCAVLVLEANDAVGGGCRTEELTLPGFRHDVCSAIHPLAMASPFMRSVPLTELGVEWIHPDRPLAHPLDGGRAAVLERSVDATAAALGDDGPAYRRLLGPLVDAGERLVPQLLGPLRVPAHPVALARFGLPGIRSAAGLARSRFAGPEARALLAGVGAHSILPLERSPSAAFGMALALLAHLVGWPMARAGSQAIVEALVRRLESLGGRIETGRRIDSLDELPSARAVMLDVTPRQLLRMAGGALPARYAAALRRYRYGPAVFKVDWALAGPIPWTAPSVAGAGTVHVGGTFEEVAAAEAAVWRGDHPDRPFVILAQQSLFDPSRAPAGRHTAWAYCHVPNGSPVDMTARVEAQVERFAPGFRDLILARSSMGPAEVERHDANYVGGDINGGVQDLRQLYTRPAVRSNPYSTPVRDLYLCSSSTPPGGGVHGMCGSFAARAALRRLG
jgi:phytoene dehydrogenase-like protein